MSAFLNTVAGVGVGAIVTFLVSRYYYRRAGEELRREATQLRRAANMIIIGLVEGGHIEPESVRVDPETRLVDFVKVNAGKMHLMLMTPEEKATMYKLLSDPLPPQPSSRSGWRRVFGGQG